MAGEGEASEVEAVDYAQGVQGGFGEEGEGEAWVVQELEAGGHCWCGQCEEGAGGVLEGGSKVRPHFLVFSTVD